MKFKIFIILILFCLALINCYGFDKKELGKEIDSFLYNTTWKAQIINSTHEKFRIPKYQVLMIDPNGEWLVINRFGICQDIICVINGMDGMNDWQEGIEWDKIKWRWD